MRRILAVTVAALALAASPPAVAADVPIGDDGRPSLEHLENAALRAGLQQNMRRLDEAVEGLEQLVRQSPDDARAKVVLARTLVRQNALLNGPRAVRLADEAIARDPRLPEAHTLRAALALETGCEPCANEALARAREIDPAAATVHATEAAMAWRELLRLMRDPGPASARQARMRELLERTEQSLRAAADAESNAVAQSGYLQWQADFLRYAGRRDDANRALERAARADPEDWSPKLRYAAAIAGERGRLVEAAALIESAGGPRNEETRDLVAAASYARWAEAWRRAPRAPETARLLAEARTEHPDTEAVFQRVSMSAATLDVAEALLQAGVYRVRRAEYRDRDGDTALANLVLNVGYVPGEETRKLPPAALALADRLLAQGANPNAWTSRSREPLLAVAARMGDLALLDRLLAAGASVHERSATGASPLMAAAGGEDEALALAAAQRLAARGASLAIADDEGRTAVMAAAAAGHDRVVAWLLARGVDPHRVDRGGLNVLDWAVGSGNEALVERLLKAGVAQTRVVGTCGVITTEARARGQPGIVALLKQYQRRAT